jgi:thioredoxin 1
MSHTVEITSKSFEKAKQHPGILLLDFWAAWCAPCRAFGPIFEASAKLHPDIVFGKVDTEAEVELASKFEVRSIPTLMIFKDGTLIYEQPGMVPSSALEDLVTQAKALDLAKILADVNKQAQSA